MGANSNEMKPEEVEGLQKTLQRINLTDEQKASSTLKQLLGNALKKGVMPKTALQINDETMEAIYTQGYNLYGQGKFKDASFVFRLLMLLDFTTPKYVLGLAACAHRLKDFPNAANLYLLCAALDPKNPLPHFHAADCYLQMQQPIMASFSLNMAVGAAGEQKQYTLVKERAALMKKTLDEQIDKLAEAREAAMRQSEESPETTEPATQEMGRQKQKGK